MSYELWYWPSVPGRGEFVRLALEAYGLDYIDKARDPAIGEDGLIADMKARDPEPFAPPYLVADGKVIAQTADILAFLHMSRKWVPSDEASRVWIHQCQLTIADVVAEAHDVHHPVGVALLYEDQKPEAARRAAEFRKQRMPKYLGWFERALKRTRGNWLAGEQWSYADLSLFQLVDGLWHAFPQRMASLATAHRRVMGLHERVGELPLVAAYLASSRRLPYGDGIFRRYPEIDGD